MTNIASWEQDTKRLSEIEPSKESVRSLEYKVLSGFPHYFQTKSMWCDVTTAQMISQWWSYSRTQQQIADVMGDPLGNGTTPVMEMVFYKNTPRANGGLYYTSSYPGSLPVDWYDVTDQIDNGRPFKIGTGFHGRAVAGYTRSSSTSPEYLYIYDPDPAKPDPYWLYNNYYQSYIMVIP